MEYIVPYDLIHPVVVYGSVCGMVEHVVFNRDVVIQAVRIAWVGSIWITYIHQVTSPIRTAVRVGIGLGKRVPVNPDVGHPVLVAASGDGQAIRGRETDVVAERVPSQFDVIRSVDDVAKIVEIVKGDPADLDIR
jgi:hypothetical protein